MRVVYCRCSDGSCRALSDCVSAFSLRGSPQCALTLNEKADTQVASARQLPSEHRQWATHTQTMTYEWRDNDGVKHVTAWSKAVRNAMLRGGAEHQMQRASNRAVDNWIKIFMSSTDSGLQRIQQTSNTGAQSDLMDSTRWGWRCMLQLQETDSWKERATTTTSRLRRVIQLTTDTTANQTKTSHS